MESFEKASMQDTGEPGKHSSKLALLGGALLVLVPLLFHLASLAGWAG